MKSSGYSFEAPAAPASVPDVTGDATTTVSEPNLTTPVEPQAAPAPAQPPAASEDPFRGLPPTAASTGASAVAPVDLDDDDGA